MSDVIILWGHKIRNPHICRNVYHSATHPGSREGVECVELPSTAAGDAKGQNHSGGLSVSV